MVDSLKRQHIFKHQVTLHGKFPNKKKIIIMELGACSSVHPLLGNVSLVWWRHFFLWGGRIKYLFREENKWRLFIDIVLIKLLANLGRTLTYVMPYMQSVQVSRMGSSCRGNRSRGGYLSGVRATIVRVLYIHIYIYFFVLWLEVWPPLSSSSSLSES